MKSVKGFTLIELMVSVFLFSVVILLAGIALQSGEAQTDLNNQKMVLQENLREVLYKMNQEVREASPSRIGIANGGATLTFQFPSSISNSGVITWSSPIRYQIGGNGTQLIRTDTGSGVTGVLANHIQRVVFASTGSPLNTVTYTVTAQRTLTNGRTLTLASTGEARPRNL